MEIHESREGDVVVLAPDGSMAGSEETSAVETKLAAVLKGGCRLLVVDCAGVTQLTGPAIRVLLMTSRKFERADGRLVLCAMNAKVRKAFAISGFDKDFVIVATREEAIQRVLEPVAPRAPRPVKKAPPKPDAAIEAASAAPAQADTPSSNAAEPAPPRPSREEIREALADILLEALGIDVILPEPALAGREAPSNPDALTDGILEALRASPS